MTNQKRILNVFCDGGARGNPGKAACAVIIKDYKNKILAQLSCYLGKTTNNIAEYMAVLEGLNWIKKHFSLEKNALFNFYLDSLLVVNQLNGKFKIKDNNLKKLAIKIKTTEKEINGKIFYHYFPRKLNKEADFLVNKTLDSFLKIK